MTPATHNATSHGLERACGTTIPVKNGCSSTDDAGLLMMVAKRNAWWMKVIEEARHGLDAYLETLSAEEDIDDARKAYLKHIKSMRIEPVQSGDADRSAAPCGSA